MEPNCKSCKHYFDGHNGAVPERCKLVMDRIKPRLLEGTATADEVRYYCGFGDFNPDWTCDKYEKKPESTKVSRDFDESKKALIDICEALCGFEESDLVELPPKEIARRIFLRIYYSENLLSFAKNEPDSERDMTDEGFLEFVVGKGYDISKEQLEHLRKDAEAVSKLKELSGLSLESIREFLKNGGIEDEPRG